MLFDDHFLLVSARAFLRDVLHLNVLQGSDGGSFDFGHVFPIDKPKCEVPSRLQRKGQKGAHGIESTRLDVCESSPNEAKDKKGGAAHHPSQQASSKLST